MITSGGCSCSLYTESRPDEHEEDRDSKLRSKYAKRGWSKAKLERALSDSKRDQAPALSSGLDPKVADKIRDATVALGRVVIVVHWYSGAVSEEKLCLGKVVTVNAADFDPEQVAVDTPYDVRAAG